MVCCGDPSIGAVKSRTATINLFVIFTGYEALEVGNLPQPDLRISKDTGVTDMAAPSLAYNAPPETGEEDMEDRELPVDFDRQWKLVNENPQDFNSWTDLLQYCEQEVRRKSPESLIMLH